MKRKRQPKNPPTPRSWEEWTLLGVVGISTLAILVALAMQLGKTPTERAEDELQKLAKNYYVEYLYPRLLGDIGVEPGKMLAEYKEKGVATTYLRQLLHYNHDENIEMAPLFQDAGCDTNTTSVRYYPTEPYGPKNYTVEYNFRCENTE